MTDDCPYLIDQAQRRRPLDTPVIHIGRSPACQIYIADRRASRHHAQVEWDGETCTLSDLVSANGTFVNGRRIGAPCKLQDGDEITVASAVFTFHDPAATLRSTNHPRLVVDAASGEVWVDRQPISLSPKEQKLLDLLYRQRGQPCSKEEIAAAVWPEYQAEVYDYQIESLVKRLREKIEPDPAHPALLVTVHARGYKLLA